ncbi:MAG: hypothetical protein ACRDH9_10010, partial [Actinomycetota bacterium]
VGVGLVAITIVPTIPASATNGEDAVISFGGENCEVEHPIARDAPPLGVGPCPGVRPGAEVWSDNGGCTFNFMFKGYRLNELGERVEAGTFMGTAGHCIFAGESEEVVWPVGTGPEARDANDVRIGEFAYAVDNPTRDFALIRLDPGVQANPQMCHFGGPTGLNTDSEFTGSPEVVQHFGQGLVFGDTVSARSGVGHMSDPNWHLITTAAIFGDSGSGVETEDGRAVGVLVAISPIGIVVTRLAPQMEPARVALELESLELQTAPEL